MRWTPVTEKYQLGKVKDEFLLYFYMIIHYYYTIIYVCSKCGKLWHLWCMDIVKNGLNAVKTLTVTDFLKVNGVNR
jgi:hypothetical protein